MLTPAQINDLKRRYAMERDRSIASAEALILAAKSTFQAKMSALDDVTGSSSDADQARGKMAVDAEPARTTAFVLSEIVPWPAGDGSATVKETVRKILDAMPSKFELADITKERAARGLKEKKEAVRAAIRDLVDRGEVQIVKLGSTNEKAVYQKTPAWGRPVGKPISKH